MPFITSTQDVEALTKRWIYYTDDNGGTGWYNARWALFAIFVAFMLVFFFGTRFLNRKRLRSGHAVIPGTSWITPPSYYQSQRQYNDPPANTEYVPPYTEESSPQDMGYYDADMKFHPNVNIKSSTTNGGESSSSNVHGAGSVDPLVATPQEAVTHDTFNNNINSRLSGPAQPVQHMNSEVYTRPANHPPPGAIVEDVTGADVELHGLRPSGPPPTH